MLVRIDPSPHSPALLIEALILLSLTEQPDSTVLIYLGFRGGRKVGDLLTLKPLGNSLIGEAPDRSSRPKMKTQVRDRKAHRNGAPMSRKQLLEAQERSLNRDQKLTAREGFESLVVAGIVTKGGKLSPRYGG